MFSSMVPSMLTSRQGIVTVPYCPQVPMPVPCPHSCCSLKLDQPSVLPPRLARTLPTSGAGRPGPGVDARRRSG